MKTFITARRTNSPKIPKPDPLGSHVSNILGRKAHNGIMKTFVPQGAQWQNENICHRQAAQIPSKSHHAPGGNILLTCDPSGGDFTFTLPPGGIYFFYKTWNGCIFHPTAYDNKVFGTIDKNKIGTISDMHVSRGGSCWYHFSVCI